jgi:hypothetical protein
MWLLEYDVYTGLKCLKEHFRAKFIEHLWEDNEARHKSKVEVNMTPNGPRSPWDLEIYSWDQFNLRYSRSPEQHDLLMHIRKLKRPLMAKCWLPKLWTMLRASICTYGKPNSVQGARDMPPPEILAEQTSPKSERLSCGAILGILSFFQRKPMNTKVEDNFVSHNVDTQIALFGFSTWDIWRQQWRVAKQENLGGADFMETKFASLSRKISCKAW